MLDTVVQDQRSKIIGTGCDEVALTLYQMLKSIGIINIICVTVSFGSG